MVGVSWRDKAIEWALFLEGALVLAKEAFGAGAGVACVGGALVLLNGGKGIGGGAGV